MRRVKIPCFFVAVAYLGLSGCATAPMGDRSRVMEIPLASVHSDLAFSMMSGARQSLSCAENTACPADSENVPAMHFGRQVQRIAAILQGGAEALYPDLTERVPSLAGSRFDVYVVDKDEPGSDSSANGRISLNAALGTSQPYDDFVAFVIAREMGHVIARHHQENSAFSIATSVILNVILPGSGLLKSLLSTGGSQIAAMSKRDVQAIEADAIAISLLDAAGFRLRDVSLSLLLTPVQLDESNWSKKFKSSTENLVAEVRSSEFAVASVMLGAPLGAL